ncbi:hypothetical protein [Haloferax sp. YSMS24]|uniref:DUF7289 family protein n=1 Tax=Haloferax sp. YSMS24 TaxID=3388425 RepID=UPI00398D0673
MTDDRGVSEVLSFVLVFALVISTIVIVYALGYPALLHVQDVERSNNAERAMTAIADTTTEITVRGAPSRATEVKLSEASLSFGAPTTVTVRNDTGGVVATSTFRPLVYDGADGTRLVYAGGGVFREQADGGFVVVRDPELVVAGSDTVILVPATTPAASTDAIAGQSDVLVRLERGDVTTVSTAGNVSVDVTADAPEAWHALLESTHVSDRSSVTVVEVRIELE